jgi:hypothetical protein
VLSSAPATISGGASLVFDNSTGTDYLYTPRGGGQLTFYQYNIATNIWATKANVTAAMSTSGNAAKRNGVIYYTRGGNTATLYAYNVSNVGVGATNTWLTLANTPGNTQYVGLVYNAATDYFHVFQGNTTLNWWKFDMDIGATGTFVGLADLPNTPNTGADLTYVGGNVYYRRGNTSSNYYRYNIASNSWVTANTAPATFADETKGIGVGSTIYYFRGSNTSTFYGYNTSNDSWFTAGTTPAGAGVNYGAALAYDGSSDYIYGTRGGLSLAFWRYQISTNTWNDAAVADLPADSEIGNGARIVFSTGNVYAITGSSVARLLRYNIGANTWTDLGNLPFAPGVGTDLVAYNNKLYAQAGFYKDALWEYTISGGTWRRMIDMPGYYVQDIGPYTGGALTVDTTNNTLYSLLGNNLSRFLSFTIQSTNYPASGTWTSSSMDLNYVSSWNSLIGTTSSPGGSSVVFQTRTSVDQLNWSGWSTVVNNIISSSTARYLQIKAILTSTSDQSVSPKVYDFTVSFSGDTTPPSNPATFTGLSQQVSGNSLISGTANSYKYTNPYFSWTAGSDSQSTISGYYVYFGTGSTAVPSTQGEFQSSSTYSSTAELSPGTYYLRVQTKDSSGNISDPITGFTYLYSGIAASTNTFGATSSFTGTTENVTLSNDQIKLANRSGFWQQNRLALVAGAVNNGAGLAFDPSGDMLYTFQGNSGQGFYRYDINQDLGSTRANAPATVTSGGRVVEGPTDFLYGARGGGFNTFWRYQISTNTWTAVTPAPLPFNAGGTLLYDGNRYIYALAGTDDAFMRYDTQNDSWESLTNTDFGLPEKTTTNNVGLGADLAYDGVETIYAIQSNGLVGFAKYNITTNTWTSQNSLPAIPNDGAQIEYDSTTNALYFIPGWSTPFFFKYDIASETWTKLSNAPLTIGAGASIKDIDGVLYIMRGLSTQTMWKYEIAKASWKMPSWGLFGTEFRGTDYRAFGTGANIVKGDGNYYYLIRGASDSQFIRYDASTGMAAVMTDTPEGATTGSSMAYDNVHNKIYANLGIYVKRLYVYDIATNSWSEQSADTPAVDSNVGGSMTFDGARYIYWAPGNGTSFYRYDTDPSTPAGSRWLQRANITAALGTGGEIVYKYGYVYALRGANTLNFYRFDPGANTWSDPLATDLPTGALMNTDSFLVDGETAALIACRGGNITGSASTPLCFNYNIGTTAWTTIANPPANINTGGAAASNGTDRIIMIAGSGTNTYQNGLYSYVIPSTTSSFAESGTYITQVHDLSDNYKFANVSVIYTTALNTTLTVYTRTSPDNSIWSSWSEASNGKQTGTTYNYQVNSPTDRYIQVKFVMTSDGLSTGVISSYSINHFQDTVAPTNPSVVSAYLDNSLSVGLTTNTWYSSTAPYFSWPAEDAVGGATDGVNGSGVAGYYVYLGIGDTADPASLGVYTTAPYYQSSSLASGFTYYLRIKTKDNAGKVSSAVWAPFVYKPDTTNPSNPTTLNVTPPTWSNASSYDFTWSGASDANSGVASYCYKNGIAGAETCTASTSVTGIAPYGTGELTFFIRTKDNAGNYSADYAPITYKHTTTAPTAPENLAVGPTASTVNEFSFTWEPPLLYSGPQSSLKYYYSVNVPPTADNVQPSIGLSVSYLTASNYATQNGTNRMYVIAKDEAGNIDYSNYAYVDFRVDTSTPSSPQKMEIADLSVKDQKSWKLALSWEPPVSTGSGVARYEVYRSETTAATCTSDLTDFDEVATTNQNNKSFVDISLDQQTYYYCVLACTSTNVCSDPSETVSMFPDGKWEVAPSMTSEPEVSVKTRTATISWSTNRKSNSFVKFGKSAGDYGEEVGSSDAVTAHEIELSTLDPGTTYYYKVLWTDEDGNLGESDEYSFSTESAPFVSSVKFSHVSLNEAFVEFTIKHAI